MELRVILEEYRDVSLSLINSIENDENNGELLLEKREELLQHLKKSNFCREELKVIAMDLELVEVEKKVMDVITIAKENVKLEILQLNKKKEANRVYGTEFRNINFINKKI